MSLNPKIVIAGASGYIGRAVIPKLLEKFPNAEITALSRSQQQSDDPRVVWKACDLFTMESIEKALPNKFDLAFYLVHSMGPTAQLDQGSFADYDLILADNFSCAIKSAGVKQLIYLGGLIPVSKPLSLHLQSRLEVEETFAQHRIPTTVFRAGLILGEMGSSFQILLKLVKRLPIMVCPSWTQTLTAPVDLMTVLNALVESALLDAHIGKVFDLAGCQPLTYIEMMKQTAQYLGKRRYFFAVPFFTPTLSRLWVSLITNTPKDLVYPLIESLQHEMIARESNLYSRDWVRFKYLDLLEKASVKIHPARSFFRFRARLKTVRSVQRLPLPVGKSAEWIKNRYVCWLPRFLAPLIKVRTEGPTIDFSIFSHRFVLLKLKLNQERSNEGRQLLAISGGALVSNSSLGFLEFRVVLNSRFVLAAIHDYCPTLPWYVYKNTQARLHLFVMKAFARDLLKFKEEMNSK